MTANVVEIAPGVACGQGRPLLWIAGPCVIESRAFLLPVAERLARLRDELGIPLVFKSSFDKANRTSGKSFRGPGLTEGLKILREVKERTGLNERDTEAGVRGVLTALREDLGDETFDHVMQQLPNDFRTMARARAAA